MPIQENTQLQNIGNALSGFGAGIQGNLPQFQAGQRQQQLIDQQNQKQQQEMAIERQKTMFTDAQAALNLLGQENYDGIVQLGMNRLQLLQGFPDANPEDTQRIMHLALAARNGSEEAQGLLKDELTTTVQTGRAIGVLQKPESELIASADITDGQIVERSPSGEITTTQVIEPQAEDRETARDSQDILRYTDDGAPVFPNDVASADRDTEKDVNGILRYVDDGSQVFPEVEKLESSDITAGQRTAAGFAQRQTEANAIITDLGEQFTGALSRTAGVIPQGLKSDDRQMFDQAIDNFISAVLRPESGAVISDQERTDAVKQYIPTPGDDEAVIEQKARNRDVVMMSTQLEAGEAFNELRDILPPISQSFESIPSNEPENTTATNETGQTIVVRNGMWELQ